MPATTYYILNFPSSSKETGLVYPQVQKMSEGYDTKGPNATRQLFRCWQEFPDFTPDLDSFVLHAKSKPTDFLSNALSARGMIVSDKVKTIFEAANTCPIRFYPAGLKYKGKSLEGYYWMHIISDYTGFVDYPNSSFFIYKTFTHNIGYIKIDSKEDLLNKEERLKKDNPQHTLAIWAEKIKLLPEFDAALDFFQIGKFTSDTYVSKRLQTRLEKEQVSGYDLSPATNLV
ncbi:imm11 family protein [Hufsiella ginkgonis]|uniref:Immunity MXAN-0049 protein domain-containing protein n=1 Tax=Hufsiella ginkgonis TaxID=2695274 RepID=A0A7K1XT26_9SPHI|nr:DUF1629 domain-containing protein [Hufsiella ginkgonis]MXV13919.1 hypothetical protein [Hufsiella ginkgonis]